jgi:hypothetical protein
MKKTLCIISLALASLHFCVAQPLSFVFDAETAPVYDLTGEYVPEHEAVSRGQTLPVAFLLGLNHESNGRIRSSGGTIVAFGNDYVAAYYTAVGSVSARGGVTRANFSVRISGYDWIAGAARRFSVSLNYRLTVDGAESALVGTVKGSVYINGVGSARIRPESGEDNVFLPLPEGVDGSWKLTLNVLSLGAIGGTGTFAVSNFTPPDNPAGFPADRLLPAKVNGSYSQRTGLSRVRVTGIYEGRGSYVTLTFNPEDNSVVRLSGKVLGQTVRVDY